MVFARRAMATDPNAPGSSLGDDRTKDFRYECIFKRKKSTLSKLGLREIPSPDLKALSK